MKKLFFILIFPISGAVNAQLPESGTYTYSYCYREWHACVNTCTVIINGDSVTVISNEDQSVPKGEIIDKGILVQHKSGKWIIAQHPDDKNARRIGGCGNGPAIIDFKKKRFKGC